MSRNSFPESDDKIASSVLDRDTAEDQVQGSTYETGRNEPIPFQKDNAPVEEPIDAENADNDKQTEQDEAEVINESNNVRGRTRGAKPRDTYKERSETSMGLGG